MFVKILCFKGFHKPEKGGDVIRHSSRLGSTRRNVDFGMHWRPGVSAYSLDRELFLDGNKGVSIYMLSTDKEIKSRSGQMYFFDSLHSQIKKFTNT